MNVRSRIHAYDRSSGGGLHPEPEVLSFMARLREDPDSDDGSGPDEGVPGKFAGHRGVGQPMMVGIGCTQREICDGQSLASPRALAARIPSVPLICPLETHLRLSSPIHRAPWHGELLVSFALGKVDECPSDLKQEVIKVAADCGFQLKMKTGDRMDVPMDFRFLDMLLRLADEHSQGVWVGPGTRMPRLRAFCKPKKNCVWASWRMALQTLPPDVWRCRPRSLSWNILPGGSRSWEKSGARFSKDEGDTIFRTDASEAESGDQTPGG